MVYNTVRKIKNRMKTIGWKYMKMVKCPKCELNYMPSDAESCEVCRQMLHGTDSDDTDDIDICPECGEPYKTGKPLCPECLQMLNSGEEPDDAEIAAEDDLDMDLDLDLDEDLGLDDDESEEENLEKLGISIVDDITDL